MTSDVISDIFKSLRHSAGPLAFGLQAQSRACVKLVGVKGWVFDDDDEEEEDADADNEAHDDEEEEEDEDDDHRDEDDVMM
jgi:hypothetical protein